jgi:GNAT superfamily N-acetyltransferase
VFSPVRPAVEIVPFRPETHLQGAVEALLRLRRVEGLYPPRADVDANPGDFAYWLLSEDVLGRWVALDDDRVAGHISITAPHPYLTDALGNLDQECSSAGGFCEVSKFFVDPAVQGKGTGTALFEAAFRFARGEGLQPALAVVDTSLAARRFYASHGMTEAGSFQGIHGENFVFVDAAAQAAWQQDPAVAALAA